MCKIIQRILLKKSPCLFRKFYVTYRKRPCISHFHIISVMIYLSANSEYFINMFLIQKMRHKWNNHKTKFKLVLTFCIFFHIVKPKIWFFLHKFITCHTAVAHCPVIDFRNKLIQMPFHFTSIRFYISDNKPPYHKLFVIWSLSKHCPCLIQIFAVIAFCSFLRNFS